MNAPSLRAVIGFGAVLLLFAAMQSTVAHALSFAGAQPDLPLTLGLCAAALAPLPTGCITGFGVGLVTASLTGQTVGSYLVTRTLAGYIAGWLGSRFLRMSLLYVVGCVGLGSAASEILYGLAVPRLGVVPVLREAFLGGAMNALIAFPATLLLQRLGWGGVKRR